MLADEHSAASVASSAVQQRDVDQRQTRVFADTKTAPVCFARYTVERGQAIHEFQACDASPVNAIGDAEMSATTRDSVRQRREPGRNDTARVYTTCEQHMFCSAVYMQQASLRSDLSCARSVADSPLPAVTIAVDLSLLTFSSSQGHPCEIVCACQRAWPTPCTVIKQLWRVISGQKSTLITHVVHTLVRACA